jgi:hypothetical protein
MRRVDLVELADVGRQAQRPAAGLGHLGGRGVQEWPRAVSAMSNPWSAKARTVARPAPADAPVITATLRAGMTSFLSVAENLSGSAVR